MQHKAPHHVRGFLLRCAKAAIGKKMHGTEIAGLFD